MILKVGEYVRRCSLGRMNSEDKGVVLGTYMVWYGHDDHIFMARDWEEMNRVKQEARKTVVPSHGGSRMPG